MVQFMISTIKKFLFALTLVAVISAPAMQLNPKDGQQYYKRRDFYSKRQARKKLVFHIQTEYNDDTNVRDVLYRLLDELYADGRQHRDHEIDGLFDKMDEEKQDVH